MKIEVVVAEIPSLAGVDPLVATCAESVSRGYERLQHLS